MGGWDHIYLGTCPNLSPSPPTVLLRSVLSSILFFEGTFHFLLMTLGSSFVVSSDGSIAASLRALREPVLSSVFTLVSLSCLKSPNFDFLTVRP